MNWIKFDNFVFLYSKCVCRDEYNFFWKKTGILTGSQELEKILLLLKMRMHKEKNVTGWVC